MKFLARCLAVVALAVFSHAVSHATDIRVATVTGSVEIQTGFLATQVRAVNNASIAAAISGSTGISASQIGLGMLFSSGQAFLVAYDTTTLQAVPNPFIAGFTYASEVASLPAPGALTSSYYATVTLVPDFFRDLQGGSATGSIFYNSNGSAVKGFTAKFRGFGNTGNLRVGKFTITTGAKVAVSP